jgi:hypothetical protein
VYYVICVKYGTLEKMLKECITLSARSYYAHPSREAVVLNDQTLLRVQRNGLKIGNKIHELEPLARHSVKPPNAKLKVQTFGHELPRPLNLDGHYVKLPNGKSKGRSDIPLYSMPKTTPPNLTVKILSEKIIFV